MSWGQEWLRFPYVFFHSFDVCLVLIMMLLHAAARAAEAAGVRGEARWLYQRAGEALGSAAQPAAAAAGVPCRGGGPAGCHRAQAQAP
jgi:hypothetical protein|eukprot:COSAG01_NODE_10683_length_2105_cov_2.314556_2_plen_88_part_00